jgi:DNA-binding XRE family transcriptional regulator
MINATQCRMARSALKWNLDKVARESNVSRTTIYALENELGNVRPLVKCALQRAFEAQGIEFLDNGVRIAVQEKG